MSTCIFCGQSTTPSPPSTTDERLMTTDELGAFLQIPPGTIAQWRHRGLGPRAVRVGRHLRWRVADVAAWIEERADPRGIGRGR